MSESIPSRQDRARRCAESVAPALLRGDATAALRELEPHRDTLATEPDWAIAYAQAAALQGNERDAVAALRHALESHPDSHRGWAALARAEVRRGDWDAARGAWETLAQLRPEAAAPWCEIGTLALASGRMGDALRAWTEALRRDPNHAPSLRGVHACLSADAAAQLVAQVRAHAAAARAVAASTSPGV